MNSEPNGPATAPPERRLFGLVHGETFAPFGYRDFRVLWLMVFVRSAALWLETVARPVLIVELTGSAFLLGAVLAAYMAPTLLLAPIAGIIIDRFPHRRVLVGAPHRQHRLLGSAVRPLADGSGRGLAGHRPGGRLGLQHRLLPIPTRRAMLPHMVEQPHLRSAMALSQTGQRR